MHPNYPPRPSKAASVVVSDRERGSEKEHREQKYQITETSICAGLLLSQDLDVWQNMKGNLRWNLDYLITEMVTLRRIKTTDILYYSGSHR